jgi:hypothetical protein
MSGGNKFLGPKGALRPRDPLSNQQQDGVVRSPPRYSQLGGLTSGGKKGFFKNHNSIKKPGNTAG